MSRAAAGTAGVLAAAGLAAFAWGAIVERNRFTVRHEVVPVLDPAARPLRVLHLSDLHLAPWQRRKVEWLSALAALEPDLVVSTGDLLGHPDALSALERALAPLAGTPGVFVHGSNDYYGPTLKNPFTYFSGPSGKESSAERLDTEALEWLLEHRLGWVGVNNRAVTVEVLESRFELFGVNDAHRSWDRLDLLPSALEELREGSGWRDDESGTEPVAIGVTHAPYRRVLDSFVTNGAAMIFAGHTHGGQVRIPGLPALVTNCDIPREQAQGLSVWHHARRAAWLNVSAGVGTSIYAPVRFACPPEAVLVTLVPTDIGYS